MKILKFCFLVIFILSFLFNCSNEDTEIVVVKEEDKELIKEEDVLPLLPHEGIPYPFNLFTVIDDNVERKDFNNVTKWYDESPNKQVFKLFVGEGLMEDENMLEQKQYKC